MTHPERRNWVWFSCQIVLRLLFATWLRFRAKGHEQISHRGGMLLVINHQSFLDPLLVGVPLRRPVSYLARANLFRVPLVGWILRHTHVVPINRESAGTGSIREMIARLKAGFWVGIFPEGTRSSDGTLGEIKPGFLALLRRANVSVCPVGIAGANEALGRSAWFLCPAKVRVVFGTPIAPDEVSAALGHGEEFVVNLIRERLERCLTEANSWRAGGF